MWELNNSLSARFVCLTFCFTLQRAAAFIGLKMIKSIRHVSVISSINHHSCLFSTPPNLMLLFVAQSEHERQGMHRWAVIGNKTTSERLMSKIFQETPEKLKTILRRLREMRELFERNFELFSLGAFSPFSTTWYTFPQRKSCQLIPIHILPTNFLLTCDTQRNFHFPWGNFFFGMRKKCKILFLRAYSDIIVWNIKSEYFTIIMALRKVKLFLLAPDIGSE